MNDPLIAHNFYTEVLGIEDVQTTFQQLKDKGIQFTQKLTINEFGTHAIFDDTCRNLIQIHQD